EGRADRDVLQIGVPAREPPGRRDGLIERRVQPPRVGIHERRQALGVRRAQLLDLAVLEDLVYDRVRAAQLFEHGSVRRIARRRPAAARQLQLLEQERAELLWRADRELVTDRLVRLALDARD